jgi:RNA polymerase sigma-70 factor (ECF subfamily)
LRASAASWTRSWPRRARATSTRCWPRWNPDVTLRADPLAVEVAAARAAQGAPSLPPEAYGARAVAQGFSGRARDARRRWWTARRARCGRPAGSCGAAFAFTFVADRIATIEILMEPAQLRARVQVDATS